MESKIDLIKKITNRHPAEGVELGLSWYKGGMADTGEWNFHKLMDMSEEELIATFTKLTDKDYPSAPLSREEIADSNVYIELRKGHFMNKRTHKAFVRVANEIEHMLIFGDGKKS